MIEGSQRSNIRVNMRKTDKRTILSDVNSLLEGAFDMHVHAAPDAQPRKTDCVELVSTAKAKGLKGVLIKDHITLTGDRASILNRFHPDFMVYGAVVLNYPVGGLNPSAVEGALRLGCKAVFMPTYCAQNQVQKWGKAMPPLGYPFPKDLQGISILDENGNLFPVVHEILALIAESDAILATGHLSAHEIGILVKEAVAKGLKKVLVSHVSLKLIDLPKDLQVNLANMGAYLEHCYASVTPFLKEKGTTLPSEIARQIRAVGPKKCILSSDLGQVSNPDPVEGFGQFIGLMMGEGFDKEEIETMIRLNPENLLEG